MSTGKKEGSTLLSPDWILRERLFEEEELYAFLEERIEEQGMEQSRRALPFALVSHRGQTRKGGGAVPYINHPLTMARHAIALGLAEDDLIAALLLHDVPEDCSVPPEQLPVGETVCEAVRLVTFRKGDTDRDTAKAAYYQAMLGNPLACLVKCIDRCNNLSGMAAGFSHPRMAEYIRETERYYPALLSRAEESHREAAWLLRYQMLSLLETCKRLL